MKCVERSAQRITARSQRDTYFDVANGGLKLREEQPGRPHLIQLERADESQQRENRCRIIEVDSGTYPSCSPPSGLNMFASMAEQGFRKAIDQELQARNE